MAKALNDMIGLYEPEVLCPEITETHDQIQRKQQYYEFLMNSLYRHATGRMVEDGEHFRRYGDYYRRQLELIRQGRTVDAAGLL